MNQAPLGKSKEFQSLVDQLDGISIWTATEPGKFDYLSKGFESIYGIPTEEVENDVERLIELIHPDDRDRVRANIESSGQESYDDSYEARIVRPDGTVRWLLTQQVILFDDSGEFIEVIGASTDITEQKRREQELEMLNRIIRHDIRNDLAVMLGWAELLSEHVDDEAQDNLDKIINSGEHIVELTEIARDYVETVVSSKDLTIEPVHLRSVLETELSLREESFPHAEFVIDDPLPDVEVTANSMLSSVFRNLLNNAVQHNDKDTPKIEISSQLRNGDVQVKIADNGPGIPDQQKQEIFGKGEKGIESPGTGVGLYLVHTLVRQYGGEIWAEDNEPAGTVFVVQLPRASE